MNRGDVELDALPHALDRRSHAMGSSAGGSSGASDGPISGGRHDLDEEEEEMNEPTYSEDSDDDGPDAALLQRDDAQHFLAEQAEQGQNFTFRGVLVGLVIGVIICFSNTYFGLQTGWVSGMTMPAALIGFGFFKTIARCIDFPFTPVENVLVQTVAGAVGTMPLGCGFVGVLPALNYLLKPEENGPLRLSTWKLVVWSIGICFFGVVFAVPLRKEVIIRERLKFPSGTATALVIGVLHGNDDGKGKKKPNNGLEIFRQRSLDIRRELSVDGILAGNDSEHMQNPPRAYDDIQSSAEEDHRDDWKAKIRLLFIAFGISAIYTLATHFIPHLRSLPVFGLPLANSWLWTLNPSPAYIGQGIIMGPATTLHMLLGAFFGWAILSPVAKKRGWAPGPVDDWTTGSKGWIVWVSLAIMLADSIISLGWLVLRPVLLHGPSCYRQARESWERDGLLSAFRFDKLRNGDYSALLTSDNSPVLAKSSRDDKKLSDTIEPDAPQHHLVSHKTVFVLFILSIVLCIAAIRYVFPPIPFGAIILSILMALLLGIVGVRALGETDLNPVSGISKLTQLFFALVIPSSNPNAITINLVAGAISESGALQAGDMMQDLKTGHLLGAAPRAQFWGQMIGSLVGAVVSAAVYRLYTSVYKIPGGMFQVPTAYVWIFTARLVTGQGLPEMAWQWALGVGIIFAFLTAARVRGQGTWWQPWIPGGIAVAVGMYNVPSFTLARTMGGLINWYWRIYKQREDTPVIVLASGLILGEGLISIVNLGLASLKVPHLCMTWDELRWCVGQNV
ncbi:OPT superfamily [Lecanora helva]